MKKIIITLVSVFLLVLTSCQTVGEGSAEDVFNFRQDNWSLVHDSDGSEEVRAIALALERKLDIQKIQIVADGKHNYRQMELVFYGFYLGRSVQEMELATDNRFDEDQIEEILSGFQYGLTYDQVAVYAKEHFDCYQMRTIKEAFLYEHLTIDEAAAIAVPSNNTRKMRQEIKERIKRRHKE